MLQFASELPFKMYKIVISENMRSQIDVGDVPLFETEKKAYLYGIQRWGSGTYDQYNALKIGWHVEET